MPHWAQSQDQKCEAGAWSNELSRGCQWGQRLARAGGYKVTHTPSPLPRQLEHSSDLKSNNLRCLDDGQDMNTFSCDHSTFPQSVFINLKKLLRPRFVWSRNRATWLTLSSRPHATVRPRWWQQLGAIITQSQATPTQTETPVASAVIRHHHFLYLNLTSFSANLNNLEDNIFYIFKILLCK